MHREMRAKWQIPDDLKKYAGINENEQVPVHFSPLSEINYFS